ncbi:MAG TPA: FlgD immunoglobulin-like domain containing protein, partial [Bacteroidota bacterium]
LITNSAGVRRIYFDSAIPFVYQLHTSTPSNYIAGIEASHMSWNNLPSSYWEFTRGTNTTASDVAQDGIKLVFFDLAGINFPQPTNTIAFSSTFTSTAGGYHAVESDLIWNARDFPPSPTGAPGQQDLQSVMTHEFGHHLGLDHTGLPGGASSGCGPQVQAATMWFSSSSGDTTKRSLHPEDVIGVSVLYPTWRLQGNVMNGAVPVVDAPLYFSGTYASFVGPVENPIGTRYNRSGYLLDTIRSDNSGLYSTIVINQSFDVFYDDFGYERDSAHIQFAPPGGIGQTETIIQNFVQQPTPIANLSGTIRDASSLTPIATRIEFYGFGDPNGLTTAINSAANGTFSVPLSSKEYYRIRVVPPSPYVDEVEIASVYLSPSGGNTTIDVPRAQVLIVDDDAGQSFQTTYQNSIDRTNRPRRTFSVADSGTTPAAVLSAFTQRPVLLWFTGSDSTNALTTSERQVVTSHLSGGGRAIITGQNIAQFSAVSDSLLEGYLGVRFDGTPTGIFVRGYIGDVIGNGVNYIALGGVNAQTSMDILQLVGGSIGTVVPSLYYPAGSDTTDVAAVRVQGPGGWGATYFGFGLEGMTPARQDSFIVRSFRYFDQIVTGVETPSTDALPMSFVLDQNYPNPFNPATQIRYGIPQQSKVQIRIFDLLGREVVSLFDGEQPAGYHSITWKGEGSSGASAASGIYFYRIDATGTDGQRFTNMKKMILLK